MAFTKKQKRVISRIFNQGYADPEKLLEFSLTGQSRYRYIENEETTYEYGFFDFDEECTDEEIDEWFEENIVRRIPSCMYWDCTGLSFTMNLDWRRNPCGLVSFVHRIGCDV